MGYGGLFNNIETGLNNKLIIINGLIHYENKSLEDLLNILNRENIIYRENGDNFNLLLNGLIYDLLLNNPLFNNWGDYIREEVFNILNGYYK